jgi:hypothetical protein
MSPQRETPPGQTAGLKDMSLPGGIDGSFNAPKARVEQAKIDLLVDDITDIAGWLVDQLNVLPAQRAAGDFAGMLYTLRRSRAYWIAVAGSARELAAVNDERLSAIRQAEGSQ